jgi:hypothetical protein
MIGKFYLCRMRQFLLFIIFFSFLPLPFYAQVSVIEIPVTVHVHESTLGDVLKDISDRYNARFFYSTSKIPVDQLISIDINNQPLYVLLDKIKTLTGIDYQVSDSKIILFAAYDSEMHKNHVSLYGFVEDSITGERLIGANIIVKDHTGGTISNAYGYYSLPLDAGEYSIICSYVGYYPVEYSIRLNEDEQHVFYLQPDLQPLEEVKVSGKVLDKISTVTLSTDEVPLIMMRTYPALLGENDPIQFLKMLPGIQSSCEASNGLYVRGSPPAQTSFLLDDAPLFNISHISGLFSSINPDAVKDIRIYKSHLPAKYGGVLASIVDIRLRDGNNQHYSVTGGIGTIASRLTIEGPIIKNKASFILSVRRSYLDQILKLLDSDPSLEQIYFYDVNGKINFTLSTRDRLYLSGYLSKDKFNMNTGGLGWNNSMLSFRWNHIYGSKLFSNVTLTGSQYVHQTNFNYTEEYSIRNTMQNYALKYDLSYYPVKKDQLDFGISANYQTILPMELDVKNNSRIIAPYYSGTLDRTIYTVYAENIYDLTSSLSFEAGVRLNLVQNYSLELGKAVLKPEPFLSTRYKLGPQLSVKGGYSRNYQFYHGENIISMIIPYDLVIFSNGSLKPQYSDNLSIGCYYNADNDQFEASLEGYYKKLYKQCNFRITEELMFGKNSIDSAATGTSEAYGLEFSLRRHIGKLTGMLSYTLSKVNKQDNGHFGSRTYNPYYDRPHNLAINLNYQLSNRISLMSTWVYMSGCPYNVPIGKYEINGISVPMFDLESINTSRMPAYHHLDIGLHFKFGSKAHYTHSLSLCFYNVYFRKNLLYYTYRDVYNGDISQIDGDNTQNINFDAIGFYIFQFVPAFSYEFKFE